MHRCDAGSGLKYGFNLAWNAELKSSAPQNDAMAIIGATDARSFVMAVDKLSSLIVLTHQCALRCLQAAYLLGLECSHKACKFIWIVLVNRCKRSNFSTEVIGSNCEFELVFHLPCFKGIVILRSAPNVKVPWSKPFEVM